MKNLKKSERVHLEGGTEAEWLEGRRPEDRWGFALGLRWYAVVNDLVGGWAVATVDKPLSACGDLEGEILDFTTEEVARHVVQIHNDWLDRSATAEHGRLDDLRRTV